MDTERKKKEIPKTEYTTENMMEALKKSGYIFESEVVKMLIDRGFTVFPNVLHKNDDDIFEVDAIVDIFFSYGRNQNVDIYLTAKIFLELKNYESPIVLFTPSYDKSNSLFTSFYISRINKQYYSFYWIFLHFRKKFHNIKLFNQYCIFNEKIEGNTKIRRLIAGQDQEINKAIKNLIIACNQKLEFTDTNEDIRYIDIQYNIPIIVLKNKIFEFYPQEGLVEVQQSMLLKKFDNGSEVEERVIYICTEDALIGLIDSLSNEFKSIFDKLSTTKRRITRSE